MLKIEIVYRGKLERELAVTDQQLVIGRGGTHCGLCLPCSAVSRRHARLYQQEDEYWLEDLGSTNGTLLNGKKIANSRLKPGDVIRIGDREIRILSSEPESGTNASEAEQAFASLEAADEAEESSPVNAPDRLALDLPPHEGSSRDPGPPKEPAPRADRPLVVHFLDGPRKGQQLLLGETLVSIGRPGDVMAAIAWRSGGEAFATGPYSLAGVSRREAGHYLVPVGGKGYPMLNGKEISTGGEMIKDGDLIEVGKLRIEVRQKD